MSRVTAALGGAVTKAIGRFDYAAEMKNASLSSRPRAWDAGEVGFAHPTFSTRFGFRPNAMWNLGFSASAGSYLLPDAAPTLPAGHGIGDYRQLVLAQDISFAWHRVQVWAEFYEARFEVPVVGNADTFAYYIEAKYKFTPQLFGALRWNQQLYATIRDDAGGDTRWGNNMWRTDTALGCRFTANAQIKLQYSFQQEASALHDFSHTLAGQFTLKF